MDVGFAEMAMLAVLALLIFGPERLPGIARTVGRTIGQIRREASSTFDALTSEVELNELREFNKELQQEREQLRSLTRITTEPAGNRSGGGAGSSAPPRFDPQAT